MTNQNKPATLSETYTFTATITSKGKQGSNWKLEFDWQLPGSRFPFVLYGREPTDIEGWNPGDTVLVSIAQGNLKSGKTGQYSTDFFYDMVSIEEPQAKEPVAAKKAIEATDDAGRRVPPWDKSNQASATPKRNPEEPPPVPQALGACQNHAMAFIESGIMPIPEGRDPINYLWELRDMVYRGVNKKPYQPQPFCYQHETDLIKSAKSGAWGHVLPDGTACVDA